MRIVYILESLEPGGGVKVVVEHAAGLAARGHDVSLVTKGGRTDWMAIPVRVVEVPRFDETTLPEADVHVATWFPTVVPAVKAARARRVFHFCQGYEAPHPHLRDRAAEIEEAYRQPIPKLVISRHLLRDIGHFPGAKHVLRQALPAAFYAPDGPEPEGPRKPATIGVVGPFLSEKKGIGVALRAVRRLAARGQEVRLLRASHMPLDEGERLFLPPHEYGHLIPAGAMPAWYHRLDLLLHPSWDAEGFPLPPLEAMASGVPVVLTDIPSYAPIPRDAASFVTPGDDVAMAREAARLLDDPASWAKRRARGLEVASTFRLEPVLDELERIFGKD